MINCRSAATLNHFAAVHLRQNPLLPCGAAFIIFRENLQPDHRTAILNTRSSKIVTSHLNPDATQEHKEKAISKYRPVATISKIEIVSHWPVVLVGECLPQALPWFYHGPFAIQLAKGPFFLASIQKVWTVWHSSISAWKPACDSNPKIFCKKLSK